MSVANTNSVLNKGSATVVTVQKQEASTAWDVSTLVMSNNNESACYLLENTVSLRSKETEPTFAVLIQNPLPGEMYLTPWRNNFSNNDVATVTMIPVTAKLSSATIQWQSSDIYAADLTSVNLVQSEPSLVMKKPTMTSSFFPNVSVTLPAAGAIAQTERTQLIWPMINSSSSFAQDSTRNTTASEKVVSQA